MRGGTDKKRFLKKTTKDKFVAQNVAMVHWVNSPKEFIRIDDSALF